MLSGRQALAELGHALEDVRRDALSHDAAYRDASRALARNELAQNRCLQSLARVRLALQDNGTAPAWFGRLEQAEQAAESLLRTREDEMAVLGKELTAARERLNELEEWRDALHGTVDAAAEALAEEESAVQRRLERDDEFQQLLEASRVLASKVERAEEKASVAVGDRLQKGQPYEQDPLFMYLWNRGYGTAGYGGRGLFRWLDGWVAAVCRYEPMRQQYWMLNEIPKRLRGHAERLQTDAEASLEALAAYETEAAVAAGLPELKEALATAEAQQDTADRALEASENELRSLRDIESRFALGTDEWMQQALQALAQAFDAESDAELARLAQTTPTQEDDELVRELADLRQEETDLRADLREHQGTRNRVSSQVHELENLRRRFKQHRFDDLRSSFGNERLVRAVLQEFLKGAISGAGVWDTLRRQQRYRDVGGAWPDFGSGGFPAPGRRRRSSGRRGGWHWPGGRSGGFRLPKSGGSRSRGGFRTGGGF